MGQHKTNPNVALAKEGKLPPKERKLGKREADRILRAKITQELFRRTGLDISDSYRYF